MDKTNNYYPELDSLRFLAFLLVLIHHSIFSESIPFWERLHNYGWMGVDLFLCLSAYLFAKLLFIEYEKKGSVNVRYFYLRRILRVWPLYFFYLGIALAYSIYIKGWRTDILIRSLGMFTFTDNLFTMAYGYNGIENGIIGVPHLWTISYEEQFYLIIPWVLQILYRLKKTDIMRILGIAMLFGMFIRALFIYYKVEHPAIWVFPFTHYESILGGIIMGLGLFDRYLNKIPSWVSFITGLTALWLVTYLPNIDVTQWKIMLTYPLIGIGVSLILFAALRGNLGPVSSLLRNMGFRYLGKISYGLYVYQGLGIYISSKIISAFVSSDRGIIYPALLITSSLIITIVIASISYQFLEKTFLRIKDRFTLINSRPI